MKKVKFLLIGQPNAGKSSLLNALIGSKVIMSNYPGTTVEITKGKKKIGNLEVEFSDTPGIYSISDRSEEEKVTEMAIFEKDIDGVVIICDACALERSLYMVLQILEADIPVIIALNFVEEAEKKGIDIDYKKIEDILKVPIVPINPLTKRGIGKLLGQIAKYDELPTQSFKIEYDDHIETAIRKISKQIDNPRQKRFIALRILEEDKDFYKYLEDNKIKNIDDIISVHPKIAKDIAVTRYGTAAYIAKNFTKITSLKKEKRLEDKIDKLLLNSIWGPILTFSFFILMFGIILYIGNLIQGYLLGASENLISYFSQFGHSIIYTVLGQGLTGLSIGISIALPYIFLFYLLIGFVEDTGLLTRFIINTERLTKKIGLPGKSFIPLLLGIGCTVPAARATRVLSSKKEQFRAASFFAFIPCSSRIAIIMGIVGFYGGAMLAFYVYITLVIFGLIYAFGLKKATNATPEPLLLELPVYRKPSIKNVFSKSWIRMKDFVYVVIPLLMIFGIIYGILDVTNLTESIVNPFAFVTSWLGLPNKTIIPLMFGFLQKDLTGPMLLSSLGSDIPSALTSLQLYTFGVASTLGIPCIIALGMFIKEFGFKKAITITILMNLYGIIIAGIIWRIISFVGNMF